MHLDAEGPFTLNLEWIEPQAFRWKKREGWLYGFVAGKLIRVRDAGGGLEFECDGDEAALADKVRHYFRLDEDVTPIHEALRQDAKIAPLVDEYIGRRILRQDPWECLVSFICSQRARVKGTATLLKKLAENYGESRTLGKVTMHTIPKAKKLAKADQAELKCLKLGLDRASTLWSVANAVESHELDLEALRGFSYEEARKRLTAYKGIGDKIADCVCLFALDKGEAFPVDRNVQDALVKRYGTAHGENAGYASQLLFMSEFVE